MTNIAQKIKTSNETAKNTGAEIALKLFHKAAKRVPAYRDFLKSHKVDPNKIKTVDDFKHLPLVDKENYLRKYPIKDLCWDGDLFTNNIISVSSGSTGEPFFWYRGKEQHEEAGDIYEMIYRDIFDAGNKSTLLVVCFAMGTWIAGTYTTYGGMYVADRGYKLNVATPSIEKQDAINLIKRLHDNYDQIIIAGYPPFVKDVVDLGTKQGVDWEKMLVKFSFAGELITEEWRDYMINRVGGKIKPTETMSIYGTADAGVIGFETPLSITVRRYLSENPKEAEELFGTNIVPTVVQYLPNQRHFEEVDGQVVFSAPSGMPLIRYNIKDTGGLFQLGSLSDGAQNEIINNLEQLNLPDELYDQWSSPFLIIKGRKDFTISFYALLIFPENIKAGLNSANINKKVSGKFTMQTKLKKDMEQYFELNIELAPGVKPSDDLQSEILQTVVKKLREVNAEYRKLYGSIGAKRAEPEVILREFGDKEYFPAGNKHRWVIK